MIESPAWRVLSLSARRILDRLEIELRHHAGEGNGRLMCTYDDFESYGVHRHAIAPAIREVVALGFVEITKKGRAGNAEFREAATYRLTYQPTDDADPTDEWRRRASSLREAKAVADAARKAVPKSRPKNVLAFPASA